MKTLLLCGYRSSLGLERCPEGRTLIERRIAELRAYSSQVVCVLSGAFADEQLRQCPRLADVELAYDNGAPSVLSNIVSGLENLKYEPCLVLPLEIPPPDRETWNWLIESAEREQIATEPKPTDAPPVALIQAVTPEGTPWHFGFPLMVTRFGNREMKRLHDLKTLLDTRLKYLHLEVASPQKAI